MTGNEHGAREAQDRQDQPDERTPLLQSAQPAQYATATTSADSRDGAEEDSAEQDQLLPCENSAPLAPGPLTPALPERIPDDDVEAHGVGSTRTADDDEGERPSFLINTQPRRFRVVFAGIMLTYFIANFDGTIMASSHPVITSHFHASNSK